MSSFKQVIINNIRTYVWNPNFVIFMEKYVYESHMPIIMLSVNVAKIINIRFGEMILTHLLNRFAKIEDSTAKAIQKIIDNLMNYTDNPEDILNVIVNKGADYPDLNKLTLVSALEISREIAVIFSNNSLTDNQKRNEFRLLIAEEICDYKVIDPELLVTEDHKDPYEIMNKYYSEKTFKNRFDGMTYDQMVTEYTKGFNDINSNDLNQRPREPYKFDKKYNKTVSFNFPKHEDTKIYRYYNENDNKDYGSGYIKPLWQQNLGVPKTDDWANDCTKEYIKIRDPENKGNKLIEEMEWFDKWAPKFTVAFGIPKDSLSADLMLELLDFDIKGIEYNSIPSVNIPDINTNDQEEFPEFDIPDIVEEFDVIDDIPDIPDILDIDYEPETNSGNNEFQRLLDDYIKVIDDNDYKNFVKKWSHLLNEIAEDPDEAIDIILTMDLD